MVDVLALHALRLDFKWVLDGRFVRIPGFGAWMRSSGYVTVDSSDPVSGREMLERVVGWLGRGIPVAVFPEGTRSLDGEVAPFKRGAFRAALRAEVPVVPVAIEGTRTVLPKHHLVAEVPPPWAIRVSILPPLEAGEDVRAPSLARACRSAIAGEIERLRSEDRPAPDRPSQDPENG